MRTGKDYLNSLNDGREVVIDGQVVRDVTAHPAFTGVCQTVAGLYDLINTRRDEMTFTSPSTGEAVALCHLIPRSIADLQRRRAALTISAEFSENWPL